MCKYATALKVGTCGLVLELIERGAAATRNSTDPSRRSKLSRVIRDLKTVVRGKPGGTISGRELQEAFVLLPG